MEGKYSLTLVDPKAWREHASTFSLTEPDMIRFGLNPSEELVGATLELILKPIAFPEKIFSPDTVIINHLSRASETSHSYYSRPPRKLEEHTFLLQAQTPVHGGTLVVLPATYYKINFPLTEDEYRRLRALPAKTALQVTLRHAQRHFRDLSIVYRGTLNDPRVFPKDYAAHMIPLVRAMIAYFGGDVDVVGHYCGIDVDEERERGEKKARGRSWTRRRDYFALDPLSPKKWEESFSQRVAQVDAELKKRYRNRLPIGVVHEFYDHIETSTWESKKYHPVQELSVGLEAKYVFRQHTHLPCIIIKARSVDGNRKACEAACEALSREAAKSFQVRFDHMSWAVEQNRSELKAR